MPIVLITLCIGVGLGYWIARMQLRGRWELAAERHSEATTALPGPWCRPEESPYYRYRAEAIPLHAHPGLIRTKRAPEGFSASDVLGYHEIGKDSRLPLYPGGFSVWKDRH